MARLSKLELNQVNDLADLVEELRRRLTISEQRVQDLGNTVADVKRQHAFATTNSLTTTWVGGTSTLSWAAGAARDKTGKYYPFPAGSAVLSPSTYYWFAWNPVHSVMAVQPSIDGLLQNSHNIVICQVFTGTAGQSGAAGGGGSEPAGNGLSFSRYKNF